MKKQLLFIAALFAVAPAFSAPSALNPRYLLPALVGVQGEHLATENLLQNMVPQAAAVKDQRDLDAFAANQGDMVPTTAAGKFINKHYPEVNKYISTPLAWKYLLSYATPIGRRAPKGFHRARMQQLASLLKFARPAICAQVGDISKAAIFALKHIPEIKARKDLADRLAYRNVLVSSWSIPAHMRGQKYLMFHGPCGYALKHLPNFLFIVKELAKGYQYAVADRTATTRGADAKHGFGHDFAGKAACKTTRAMQLSLVKALPFLSLTTKYYMLESDYKKLSPEEQVAVYQAVYEDVTNFSDSLVDLLAPAFTQANYASAKTWSKDAWAKPGETFEKAKTATVAQVTGLPTQAKLKWNDWVAYAESLKPSGKKS